MSAFFVLFLAHHLPLVFPLNYLKWDFFPLQILVLNRKQKYFPKGTNRLSCRFESQVRACQMKNRIPVRRNSSIKVNKLKKANMWASQSAAAPVYLLPCFHAPDLGCCRRARKAPPPTKKKDSYRGVSKSWKGDRRAFHSKEALDFL